MMKTDKRNTVVFSKTCCFGMMRDCGNSLQKKEGGWQQCWLVMMTLSWAMSFLAEAVCVGTELALDKDEAALWCPLPVNVKVKRHSIIVKHFPKPDADPGEVLFCYWPTEEADKPECESSDGFSLVGQLTDQVVAKVPVSKVKDSGDYQCQLMPPDQHRPFTPCRIYRFNDTDETKPCVDTCTAVVSSTTVPSWNPLEKEIEHLHDQVQVLVGLTSIILLFLVAMVTVALVVGLFYWRRRRNSPYKVREDVALRAEDEPMSIETVETETVSWPLQILPYRMSTP